MEYNRINSKRFEFGANWKNFLKRIDSESIEAAKQNIQLWLGEDLVKGKTVLDIGCGSGLHSLSYFLLGASKIVSFDYDEKSVEATKTLWKQAGSPINWIICQGSILDESFVISLGKFDIVYSWGVLHHTGDLWGSIKILIKNTLNNNSKLWIAIYQGVKTYEKDLALKMKYNNSNYFGKKILVYSHVLKIMKKRRAKGLNPFSWNEKRGRGMNTYNDLVDWLGGFPYEVCSVEKMKNFMTSNGNWRLIKYNDKEACAIYLFDKTTKQNPPLFVLDSY